MKWNLDAKGIFMTKAMAKLIDEKKLSEAVINTETPKNKALPQKVAIFIWRSLMNRLPTSSELDKREIDLDTTLCPICNNQVQNVEHILVNCPKIANIWELVLKWWNFHSTGTMTLDEAFVDNHQHVNRKNHMASD
ncbi:uncharacterized protein [Rutidosis leptorrhynchoides]|uniref:uncharacterized protein n=1 Tax=Rutidosis leptorrhynchoides TaxID=125765 RepID=UPI003A9A5322